MGGFRYPSFTFQVSGPSALQKVKNWCHEFKSKGGRGNAHCDLSSFWIPFPGLTHFIWDACRWIYPALVSLRSCSGRQGNPAQKLLLTFLFWLLLNGPLGVNRRRCISLQLSIWPTICWHELFLLEKRLKDDVAITQRYMAPSCHIPLHPQGHPCASKCHSCNPVKQDWPPKQLFSFPSPPFPALILPGVLSAHQLVIPFTLWALCRQQDVSTFSFKVSLTTCIAFLASNGSISHTRVIKNEFKAPQDVV